MLDLTELTRFTNARLECLESHGIKVRMRSDFQGLYDLDLPGKEVSPLFSPQHFDMSARNGFWIEATQEGQVVQVQAIRLQDTGRDTLSEVWRSEFRRLFGPKGEGLEIAPEGRRFQGKITYHGDLWISEELRGMKLGPVFATLGLAFARMTFDPDYCYGFMIDPVSYTGYHFREGFWHATPVGDGWVQGEPFLLPTDYLVYVSREDFERLVQRDRRQTASCSRPSVRAANKDQTLTGKS